MKDFFKNISNDILDNLDMSQYQIIDNEEYQNYYVDKSSKEHYRLLTYISNSFNGYATAIPLTAYGRFDTVYATLVQEVCKAATTAF